ncbi:MAG: NHLP family bacteriocin export ABC transporter permease/ATPase subunit, partial [Oribacterium sp.]|nr:NHLP family bacteriocin export ABC transporter permease/ATPase subunit [Oribacterium sp.]
TTLALTLVGLLAPRINLFLFRNVIDNGKISLLVTTAMFLLCVSWSTLIFSAARNLISTRIDTKMSVCVEAATMMRVLSLPADFFKKYSSGDLAARANHVNSLCSTLVSVVLNTGLTSVFSLVYIFEIFAFAPGLVIPALSIIIITVGFSVISSLVQMRITKKQMLLSSQENGMSYAVVSGIQKVKLTGAEKRVFARWGDLYSKNAELLYNPPLFIKINGVISIAITLIGTIVIYNQAIVNHVSPAEYYAFNTAYAMVFGAFMALFSVAITAANIKPTLEMAEPRSRYWSIYHRKTAFRSE